MAKECNFFDDFFDFADIFLAKMNNFSYLYHLKEFQLIYNPKI